MEDWELLEAVKYWPQPMNECPCCGRPFWHLNVPSEVPWSFAGGPLLIPFDHFQQDLVDLKANGITTVRDLLDVSPSELQRNTEIAPERLSQYRIFGRLQIFLRARHAWHDLYLRYDHDIRKISYSLALQMAEQERRNEEDRPIEVIIDMADKLSFDE